MGASPDGIVSCACHGRSLMEVKCPCNCSKQLFSGLEGSKSFCVKEHFQLDRSLSYYYQVQCQLNIICEVNKCYFLVWSPDEMHVEEVESDSELYTALLPAVDEFVIKSTLPEVIAHWFT